MKDVTLRQLRFLTEVVRTGSLAGAASRLHLTAPAIAQQLRLLERSVGLALIERGPAGQRATEAGRLLVDASIRVDAELAVCAEALGALRSAAAGHVTLGAVSTAKYFAPFVLASFQRVHPAVRIALRIGNRDDVLSWLADFEIDLAVMGRPPAGLEVEQEVFGEHLYVIVASPSHRLADLKDVPFEEVAVENFLVRERGSGTRQHLDALFTTAGAEPTTNLELDSNETIKQSVMAGLGIALISAHTVAAEVRDGRLAVLDVQGLPIRRHWLVVRMARRASLPACRALWEFVVAEAGGQLPVLAAPGPACR